MPLFAPYSPAEPCSSTLMGSGKGVVAMSGLNWSSPGLAGGPHWYRGLEPYWQWVLTLMDPVREDALGQAWWQACVALIDELPPPATAEEAESRWREFVGGVWQGWEQYHARLRARPKRIGF